MKNSHKALVAFCFVCGLFSAVCADDEEEAATAITASAQPDESVEKISTPESTEAETSADASTDENAPSDEEMPAGASTVDFSEEQIGTQGNWVKKKRWVSEAQEQLTAMQEALVDIKVFRRENYEEKASDLDNEFEQFYRDLGIKQGGVDELFNEVIKEVDDKIQQIQQQPKKSNEQLADKAAEVYEMADQMIAYKGEVEQLKLDVGSVEELDKAVGDRIKKLDEYIMQAADELEKAQGLNKQISYIIDHEKARKAFYQLKGIGDKIKAIQHYVKETLAVDFDHVIAQIKDHVSKTQASIKSVEDKGITVRKRTAAIKADDFSATSTDQKQGEVTKTAEEKKALKEQKGGVIELILSFFVGIFAMIMSAIEWLIDLVIGSK